MKKRKDSNTLDAFDKEIFKAQFEKVLPQIITELSDLFETPAPRITKRHKQEMMDDISWGLDVSIPHLKRLETNSGDLTRIDEAYLVLDKLLRTYLQRARIRRKPNEDAIDCFVRKSSSLLRSPYPLKRQKQFRIAREGIDRLVHAALTSPNGLEESQKLIDEFGKKHLKEYLRFANAIDARLKNYRNIDLRRLTPQNVTRLTDLYRDLAAAFETRLRLLVGLNFVTHRKTKAYAELRGSGYNQLLQAVDSRKNPLLHFLRDVVNRHVRNAMMHGGVSSSRSKGTVTFVDYSPSKKKEMTVTWTMAEFFRRTRSLYLTTLAVTYLEQVIGHWQLYCRIAVLKHLRTQHRR